jgi:glycosyltransferase involved in cell wall biosynthesis
MKNKITLLFNADCSQESFQAQDRDAKNWIHFLNEESFRVITFAKGTPDKRVIKDNVRIIYLLSKIPFYPTIKILLYLLLYPAEYVILSKGGLIEKVFLRLNKLNPFKKKVIYFIVNLFPYEDYSLSRDIVNNSQKLLAISKSIQDDIYNFSKKKSTIVHLSYDFNQFYPENHSNERIRVICVGSLQIRKQPFIFADAAKCIPEADFVWVGEGYYFDLLQKKKNAQGISNLSFIGSMSNENVAHALRKSDIFFFPSMHEGFPNCIVEAMASGLAIVAYHSYCPEAVLNGINGYICENVFEMVDKIRTLIADKLLLQEFKRASVERATLYNGLNNIGEFENAIAENIY